MDRSIRHLLTILFLLTITTLARAHDIEASDALLCIRPTGIDLELNLARASGALLIKSPNEPLSITVDNFPTYAPRLQSLAPTLITLINPDGQPIPPDAATVTLNDQLDLKFDLHFPPLSGSPIKLHAAYVERMPDSHIASFHILSARGDDLARADLHPDAPDLTLPASATATHPSAIPPTSAPPIKSDSKAAWPLTALGAALALAAALIALLLLRTRAQSRRPSRPAP